MLAKVLKSGQQIDFMPFPVPEIGGSGTQSKGVTDFIVPAFAEIDLGPVKFEQPPAAVFSDEEFLQDAREEAMRIIAKAEENKEFIEQAAREKALLDARASIEAEVTERVAELRQELVSTIANIAALADNITTHAENDLVELALKIAKKVVCREVTIDRDIALTLVKVSLGKLHNRSVAEVHLNPEDFAFVDAHREKLDFRGALELVEDRSISVGGCLIHTETGDIDARIESQFDEIAHGLLN
jgi:flagellar assembly protein FliH